MDRLLFSGVLQLPWWGHVLTALLLTHFTIVAVTVFLHRHQAHRALSLHPVVSHLFRFWLWLTTGMVTREWVAIHRKHHAKVDTPDDPHSPQVLGINRVLWGGVLLYVRAGRNRATIERYGHGAPADWLERNVYSRHVTLGLTAMAVVDLVLFGLVPGALIFVTQIAWIPFWAAGVINGIGHYWGYRSWPTRDASTNIVPWGLLIGGEELHNNHHAFSTSAKLSNKWFEFDIGWMYIRVMAALRLATVHRVAPALRIGAPRTIPDLRTLQAVITHRYDVMAHYARSIRRIYQEERAALQQVTTLDALSLRKVETWLQGDDAQLPRDDRMKLAAVLARSHALQVVYSMHRELRMLWERSTASNEQLVCRLQDWCRRAEASGIPGLAAFSRRLRSYA